VKTNLRIRKQGTLALICTFVTIFLFGCSTGTNVYDSEWDLRQLHILDAWNLSQGFGETIAFIDTGISPELVNDYNNRIVAPFNALNGTTNVNDKNGHGTEMITAACGNGIDGIWVISPKSKIMPIVAFNGQGITSGTILARAIRWAIRHNASVINLSLGSITANQDVTSAIKYANSKRILVIAAAGDYGDPTLLFPAKLTGVISVEAQGQNGKLYRSSNYGPAASIMAPGEGVPVLTVDENGYLRPTDAYGTSVSTAIVSGLSAMVLSIHPNLTVEEMVAFLRGSLYNGFINANTLVKNAEGAEQT